MLGSVQYKRVQWAGAWSRLLSANFEGDVKTRLAGQKETRNGRNEQNKSCGARFGRKYDTLEEEED